MQCRPDFVGASAMVALSAALGRKVGVRPQAFTDWLEVGNLWGCIIARPGAMKSPAMNQAFAPLIRLEANSQKANDLPPPNTLSNSKLISCERTTPRERPALL